MSAVKWTLLAAERSVVKPNLQQIAQEEVELESDQDSKEILMRIKEEINYLNVMQLENEENSLEKNPLS